jgi:phage shock protein C
MEAGPPLTGEKKMSAQYKSLFRSQQNRMIGGVCGGLGEYFGIDPTLVRVLFVVGSLLGFAGAFLLGYLILLIVVPNEPGQVITPAQPSG